MTAEQRKEVVKALAYGYTASEISMYNNLDETEVLEVAESAAPEVLTKRNELEVTYGRIR